MTVRNWFRLQRAALWSDDRADTVAGDLDAFVTKVLGGQPIDAIEDYGRYVRIIFQREVWEANLRMVNLARQLVEQATADIERELQRQQSLATHAKDLLS